MQIYPANLHVNCAGFTSISGSSNATYIQAVQPPTWSSSLSSSRWTDVCPAGMLVGGWRYAHTTALLTSIQFLCVSSGVSTCIVYYNHYYDVNGFFLCQSVCTHAIKFVYSECAQTLVRSVIQS